MKETQFDHMPCDDDDRFDYQQQQQEDDERLSYKEEQCEESRRRLSWEDVIAEESGISRFGEI